jgi:hypothetical protein
MEKTNAETAIETNDSPVQVLLKLNLERVVWIVLQPSNIKKPAEIIPTPKCRSDSIIPFNDFLEEIKKQMKGVSSVTSRYESKEMLRGNYLLAISMILGVLGMYYANLYVTVSIVTTK